MRNQDNMLMWMAPS